MIFVGIDWAEAHHDVCVLDPEGEVLATLGAGDFMGEIAMVEDVRRTATVVTTAPTTLGVMARREFGSMYDGMPSVRSAIDEAIRRRK